MKFVISTQELNFLMRKIQNVIPAKATMPILSNVLVEAKNGMLTLIATDLTVGIRCTTEAKIMQEGSTTLPAKRFLQLIQELTAINVELETSAHHLTEIRSGASRFKINGMSGTEFPSFPDLSQAMRISLPQKDLKDLLFATSFAVSKEDNRYVLTGALMRIANQKIMLLGTDGKRLARAHLAVDIDPAFMGSYVIPIKAVEEMIRNLQETGAAHLYLMADKIGLDIGGVVIITKLLAGEYPDVSRVIPERSEATIALHREELISLLRQVDLFSVEGTHSVRFSFSDGELRLSANSPKVGEAKVSMPVNYQGPKIDIAFNSHFFLDILSHSKEKENIKIGLTNAFEPAVLTYENEKTAHEITDSTLFVLMPMRLSEIEA